MHTDSVRQHEQGARRLPFERRPGHPLKKAACPTPSSFLWVISLVFARAVRPLRLLYGPGQAKPPSGRCRWGAAAPFWFADSVPVCC